MTTEIDTSSDELVRGVDDAIDRLLSDRDALLKSCKTLFGMIERGELVRDISNDAGNDFYRRMFPFVTALNEAQKAIGGR